MLKILLLLFYILLILYIKKENYKNVHKINIIGVAKTEKEKERGLMFLKKKLPDNSGLLFIYKNPKNVVFWMKNTYIPLDILFLDKEKRVIGKCENLEPHSLKQRKINKKSKYAIELNGNEIKKMNIKKNDFIELLYV